MEIKKEVKTFLVSYQCVKCEVGEMEHAQIVLPSTWGGCTSDDQEPQWHHKCNTCSCECILKIKYPYTTYEYY